jgi:hypothetical protein
MKTSAPAPAIATDHRRSLFVLDPGTKQWISIASAEGRKSVAPLLQSPRTLATIMKQAKECHPLVLMIETQRMLPPHIAAKFKQTPMLQFKHSLEKRVRFHESCKAHDGMSSFTTMFESICRHVLTSEHVKWDRIRTMAEAADHIQPKSVRFMRIQIEKCIMELRSEKRLTDDDDGAVPVVDWCSGRIHAFPEDEDKLLRLRAVLKQTERAGRPAHVDAAIFITPDEPPTADKKHDRKPTYG